MTNTKVRKVYVSRFFSQNPPACDTEENQTDSEYFKGFTSREQQTSSEISLKVTEISKMFNDLLKNLEEKSTKSRKSHSRRKTNESKSIKNYERLLNEDESTSKNNIEDTLSNRLGSLSLQTIYNKNEKIVEENYLNSYSRKLDEEARYQKFGFKPEIGDIPNEVKVKEESDSKCFKGEIEEQKYKVETEELGSINCENTEYKYDVRLPNFTPKFIPPKSPHNLLEEDLYFNPWALLVATIFLNKTSCKSARPFVFWFLEENPDPQCVLMKKVGDLEKYFVNLGLQRTRATQIWRMSHDFLHKDWKNVKELYGIGRYGEEAYRMFCLGDFNVEPKDRFLKIYKAWFQMMEKAGGLSPEEHIITVNNQLKNKS